jgi:hypothetical protein
MIDTCHVDRHQCTTGITPEATILQYLLVPTGAYNTTSHCNESPVVPSWDYVYTEYILRTPLWTQAIQLIPSSFSQLPTRKYRAFDAGPFRRRGDVMIAIENVSGVILSL